jgi:CRP/FNR family cyclic AMP-dependent transcriptional regulator
MDDLAFLRSLPMFAALGPDELVSVQAHCRAIPYRAGEMIIRQGDVGADLYVLRDGEVAVRIATNTGAREVAKLGAGALFGEMSLFDAYPRSATVVAAADSVVYLIEKDAFRALAGKYPEILFEMCRMFSARLRNTNRVMVESDA